MLVSLYHFILHDFWNPFSQCHINHVWQVMNHTNNVFEIMTVRPVGRDEDTKGGYEIKLWYTFILIAGHTELFFARYQQFLTGRYETNQQQQTEAEQILLQKKITPSAPQKIILKR